MPAISSALTSILRLRLLDSVKGGGVLLREVHGYFCGVGVTAQQLENLDHYGIMSVEDTGSVSLQTSKGPMVCCGGITRTLNGKRWLRGAMS